MTGVSEDRFDPEGVFTRAQLATVLYRLAGSPKVSGEDAFDDTQPGAWYADAVLWASQSGVVSGYGNGIFGTNDPTTQEQLAAMLWRSAGSYVLGKEYYDENGVENKASPYAVDAVRWARVDELLTDAVPFAPQQPANRAQVADMVNRYLKLLEKFSSPNAVSSATKTAAAPQENKTGESRVLVAYFSCTNNTAKIAEYAADFLKATLWRIEPETPYTEADRNWNDADSRTTKEQNDSTARPAIRGKLENFADYDVVFLGYPIWWGQAPKILYTFVESYDFAGKTVVPFCTSGSSPIGSSAENLSKAAPGATWLEGRRFPGGASKESVEEWIGGLNLKLDKIPAPEQPRCVLLIEANGKRFYAHLEDNSSAKALIEKLRSQTLTVSMHDYGGFEKVGELPWELPRNDRQIAAQPGDVILYEGNQITVYYGENNWNFTRLARIGNVTKEQLTEAFGAGDVSVKFSLEWSE